MILHTTRGIVARTDRHPAAAMRKWAWLVPIAVAVFVVCAPPAAFAGQTYAIHDIGSLGGGSQAWDVNADGTVVGDSTAALFERHVVTWSDGVLTDLGTFGYASAFGYEINDDGTIVGDGFPVAGGVFEVHPYVRAADGTLDDLFFLFPCIDPGFCSGLAGGINSDDVAVASLADFLIGRAYALRWSRQGHEFLPSLIDPGNAYALGIAPNNAAVGLSTGLFSDQVPTLWPGDGGAPFSLGTLDPEGGDDGIAYAVNGHGQVVGQSISPERRGAERLRHAFRWEGGVMTDLGTLGHPESQAMAINDAGTAVGVVAEDIVDGFLALFDPITAAVWPADRRAFLLEDRAIRDADWTLDRADGINDDGIIAGMGTRDGSGVSRGFVAVPDLQTSVAVTGGTLAFAMANGEPGTEVAVLGSRFDGLTPLPGCPGGAVDLNRPKILGTTTVAADGTAQLDVPIPPGGAGRTLRFQAASTGACMVGNGLIVEIP